MNTIISVAVLEDLRSVHNVGSIFRTANAAGIKKIYLCGTTPTPLDKKGERRKDFAKVALGAENTVSWEYVEKASDCIRNLKNDGYYIIAFEQDERAVDYKSIESIPHDSIAFVIGNEVDGVSKEILNLCDIILEIPMIGTKESLNVTIAFGIGVYRVLGL